LKILEASAIEPINIITTNGTQIGVGFFLFLGFVLSSFVLSTLVKKKYQEDITSKGHSGYMSTQPEK